MRKCVIDIYCFPYVEFLAAVIIFVISFPSFVSLFNLLQNKITSTANFLVLVFNFSINISFSVKTLYFKINSFYHSIILAFNHSTPPPTLPCRRNGF